MEIKTLLDNFWQMGSELSIDEDERAQELETLKKGVYEDLILDIENEYRQSVEKVCVFDKDFKKEFNEDDVLRSEQKVLLFKTLKNFELIKYMINNLEFYNIYISRIYFLRFPKDRNERYNNFYITFGSKGSCTFDLFKKGEWEVEFKYSILPRNHHHTYKVNFKYRDKVFPGKFRNNTNFEIDHHEMRWDELNDFYNFNFPFDFKNDLVNIKTLKVDGETRAHINLNSSYVYFGELKFKNVEISDYWQYNREFVISCVLDTDLAKGDIRGYLTTKNFVFKFEGERKLIETYIPNDYKFFKYLKHCIYRLKGVFESKYNRISMKLDTFTTYYHFRNNKIILKNKNNIVSVIMKNEGDNIKIYKSYIKRNNQEQPFFMFYSLTEFCDSFNIPQRDSMKEYGPLKIEYGIIEKDIFIMRGTALSKDMKSSYGPLAIFYSLLEDSFEIYIDFNKILFYEDLYLQILYRYKGNIQFKFL